MKKNKILYTIDYDKIVNFKERVTRFTVRFEFKRSENENQFLKEVDSLALANVHTKPHLNNRTNPFTKSYAFY